MYFLNARCPVGWHADVNVGFAQEAGNFAPPLAGQRNDAQIVIMGGLNGFDDVARVARG